MLSSIFLKMLIHLRRSKVSKCFQIFLSSSLNDHLIWWQHWLKLSISVKEATFIPVKLLLESRLMDIIIPLYLRKKRGESYIQSVFTETKCIILEIGIWAFKRQSILLYMSFKIFISLQKYVGSILQKM